MENLAEYPKYTFLHAKAMMDEIYDIDMQEDSFIEKAYMAYKRIGNKYTRYHVYNGIVGVDNKLVIPENVEFIESVNYPTYFTDMLTDNGLFIYHNGSQLFTDVDEQWSSKFINKSKRDRNGRNITYELLNDHTITFPQGDFSGQTVAILYHGLLVDEDCDPLLYYKEVEAIAYYVAFMNFRRLASKGDPVASNMMAMAKQEASIAIAGATIPEQFTQNELDQIMNVNVSMDRKVYNRSYKFKS